MHSVAQHIPYDVLRKIIRDTYVYKMDLCPEELEFDLQVPSPPIIASHVCRNWRNSLVSDPTMWTCLAIDEMGHDWITELLGRSKTAPLNVFLHVKKYVANSRNDDETQELLASVFHQIYRFNVLRVRLDYTDAPHTLSPLLMDAIIEQVLLYLQQPAPNLEVLSLWYNAIDRNYVSVPEYSIINNLFSKNAPNVRRMHHRLSVSPLFGVYDGSAFHKLSELSLALYSRMNFRGFLDLLALSPGLKLLHVSGLCEGHPAWESITDGYQVNLPHLESLILEVQEIVVVDYFLRYVVFPQNIEWYINSENTGELQPSLLQFLSRERFTSIEIDAADFEEYVRLFSIQTGNNHHDLSKISEFSYINLEGETSINSYDPLIFSITLTNTTHMTLMNMAQSTGAARIFALTSNLRSLTIEGTSARTRVGLVSCSSCLSISLIPLWEVPLDFHALGLGSNDNLCPPFCPLLQEVTIKPKKPLDENHANLLRACCILREIAGYPIQTLHLDFPLLMDEEMSSNKEGDNGNTVVVCLFDVMEGERIFSILTWLEGLLVPNHTNFTATV